MKEKQLINRAIKRGQLIINIPAILIFVATLITGLIIFKQHENAEKYYLASLFISFLLSWIYWSCSITAWKVWAYKNVNDIELLEREAVKGQLLWSNGSWFNKTAFTTKKQKKLLGFYATQPTTFDLKTNNNFPTTTRLYYPKSNLIIDLLLPVFMGSVGVHLSLSENQILGFIIIILSAYRLINGIKKVRKASKLRLSIDYFGIVLNDKKYSWDEIIKFEAQEGSRGRSDQAIILITSKREEIIDIGDFNIHADEINERIEFYKSTKN